VGLFDRLKKQNAEAPAAPSDPKDALVYTNMRVEVTGSDGRMLFVAKVISYEGDTAELRQYSGSKLPEDTEPIHVHIRGYHDRQKKAVYMEGMMSPKAKFIWNVEQLTVVQARNDRAFFRLDTNLKATVTKFSATGAEEQPCQLLNISVGGVRIASEQQYLEGDKLLLKVRLSEGQETSIMFCQVLREIEKGQGAHEYGCQFLELTEAEEEKITRNIFAAQRKMRGLSM